MNTIALLRENPDPTDQEIRAYLAGNLCRCSGYDGQLRGIRSYLESRRAARQGENPPAAQPEGSRQASQAEESGREPQADGKEVHHGK